MEKIDETRDFVLRLLREGEGFVVTSQRKTMDAVADLLGNDGQCKFFKSYEAAQAEFDHVKALALFWDAVMRYEPRTQLLKDVVRLEKRTRAVCRRSSDEPLVFVANR
ncbi:MAG: hypothetical protein ACE5EM_12600 [Sphingomonadales bacterium]